MSLEDLSNLAQIAGPILVIISFGFIWFQLREGVRLARAEHARSLAEHAASFNSLLIEHGELAELWYSYGQNIEPNTSAYLQYREMLVQWLILHENIYYQKKRKLLDSDIYEVWQRDLEVTIKKHNLTVIGTRVEDVFPGEFGRHLRNYSRNLEQRAVDLEKVDTPLTPRMATSKLARLAKVKVLILLFLAALPFILFVFPYRNTALKILSGQEKPTLDSNLNYDATEAYKLFDKLKDEGRWLYAWSEITADLIFPIIYALFLSLLIIYIFQKCALSRLQQWLAILPFLMLLFDYGENFLIAFMLFDHPREHMAVAEVASGFTKLKWSSFLVSVAAIFFGLICLVIKSVRKTGKAH